MKKGLFNVFMFAASGLMFLGCNPQLEGDPNNGGSPDAGVVNDAGESTDCDGEDDGSRDDCPGGFYACEGECLLVDTDCTEDDGSVDNCPTGTIACNGRCVWDGTTQPDAGTNPDSGTSPDTGCPECGDGNVRIYAGTEGNISVDMMCLNAEFTESTNAADFGAYWVELESGTDINHIQFEDNIPYTRCARYNTVVRNNGSDSWLCFGYGTSARITATTHTYINGQEVPVGIVSVVWTEGGQTLYGCSAMACTPGSNPPQYLDLR